ncbi:Triple functional domain protein [Dirofilaria immitis]
MLRYSKSIRSRTQSLYRDAKRRFNKSVRCRQSGSREPGHNEGCIAVGDFKATEKGQLSVTKGQRLEVVEYCADAPEWVLVSITWENGEQQRGLVPCSVISSIEPTDGSSASCSTDRPLVDPLYSLNNSSSTQNIIKRKSLRRFFSNGQQQQQQQQQLQQQQQQQGSSSGSHSRPQSVSLITRKGSGQQLRHSTADPLHSGSSSLIDQQHQNCVLSGDLVETDLTVGTTLAGGAHSVLSSCDDQINSTSEQEEETTAGGLLSVNPRLIDPASESTASLSDQGEFELPPPMSELSSAVADAAASRNTSMEDEHANDMLVVCPETTEDQNGGSEKEEKNPQDIARQKRQYVLMEFVETERDYVKDLSSVVDGYMANLQTMELPEDLVGKDKIIFANIAQILDFHKALFLKEIEKCLEDYEAVGNAFIKYERRLHTYYVKYCQNKPKSDFLMAQDDFEQFFAETKQKLGHKIALCDLLIKPVQRIMKYQLLMKDILKYTERAGDRTDVLEKALQVMHVVPKACDDMMQVGRLQNFDGNLNAQGKLIYQGTVAISDNAPSQPFKGKDRRIFLFEQSAIIADCILPKKEFGNPTYIFKSQIMVNKISLQANVPDEPLRFILKSNDPTQPNGFLAQANTMEEKDQWISKISSQLDQQKTFLAALVDPKRYQNQLAGSVNSLSLEEMEKKKALFPRLTGKSKESSNGSSGASSSLMHQNSNTQVLSSKSNSMAKSSKLFGFGKKMSPANSNKSAAGLFPEEKNLFCHSTLEIKYLECFRQLLWIGNIGRRRRFMTNNLRVQERKEEICKPGNISDDTITERSSILEECLKEGYAIMNCSFSAVEKKQINCHRGEKVKILNVDKKGYAEIEKRDGKKGYIPSYFLDLNTVPGDNFAQQIRYRRQWYHLMDSDKAIIFNDNPSNLLNNISYLTNLISFLPVQKQSFSLTFSRSYKRPICIEPLQDMKMKLGERIILMCKFFSDESYTITWRGPVITAKRQYEITTNEEGYSILTIKKCMKEDSGQYWAQAENIFGRCHTVAWITIIALPGITHITTCKAINRNSVLLQWKSARKDKNDYKVAIEGKIGPTTEIDLNLAYSLSSSDFLGDARAEYIDEATYAEIYTIIGVVYKGKFAEVKQIICKNDKKQYAAKYFTHKFTQCENEWKNIEREISIMRCIRHRNIVAYRETVKMNNQLIMIMQWLNGPHLLEYILRLGYISEALIQRFCKDLLSALEYLHSIQIAHLDIKPENLLTHVSNVVRLMVINFGSSRRCNDEVIIWNYDAIDFASPEQISYREITTKSDIWSFGIVLHILTTGRIPFEDEYYEVMRLKILSNISTIDDIGNYRIHSQAIIALLKSVIVEDAKNRFSATECLKSEWMQSQGSEELFLVDYLEDYKERRKEQLQKIARDRRTPPFGLFGKS